MMPQELNRVFRTACLIASLCAVGAFISCEKTTAIGDSDAPATPRAVTSAGAAARADNVFVSPLAGVWYSADKEVLAAEIDGYLSKVTDQRMADICAVIVPHAGYRYSGPTAAHALHQLRGLARRRVIVLGPTHRVPMENVASVPECSHYATPLGQVPLDGAFIARLREHPEFQNIPHAHEEEHSVQIQLPLLQRTMDDFQLVPIVLGQLDRSTMRRIGGILRSMIGPETLVVASSDFTHYGTNFDYVPFTRDVPRRLEELDNGSIKLICNKDLDGFCDYIDKTETTICGRCAIGVLLAMLPEDAALHVLHYETSGKMTGDFSNSVSYYAVAVKGKWSPAESGTSPPAPSPDLSDADKSQLIRLARGTLTRALESRQLPTPEELGIEVTPAMKRISGAFVTLHKDGELRGCVGEVFPSRPLYRCVMLQAMNAGLQDHRFPAVALSELDDITFEISVLTPTRPVASASEIRIGRHGIVLKKAGRSALFLPQVAVEQGWDLDTTLSHLSLKAGLPEDDWREGATFEVFEAIVFGEHETSAKRAEH